MQSGRWLGVFSGKGFLKEFAAFVIQLPSAFSGSKHEEGRNGAGTLNAYLGLAAGAGLLGLARTLATTVFSEEILEGRRARARGKDFCRAGVAFIHVPRSAGTSIASTLFGRFIGHFTIRQFLAKSSPEVLELPRFTIVRNPWDRLVSAYEFARAGRGEDGPQRVMIARPWRYHKSEYADFGTFVREHVAKTNTRQLDGVFRPQLCYILDDKGEMPFDFIGRFDQLEETEAWLAKTLGRPVVLPRFNATRRADYRSYYTDETRELVGEIYAETVRRFSFEF
jgi:hypothetical protein